MILSKLMEKYDVGISINNQIIIIDYNLRDHRDFMFEINKYFQDNLHEILLESIETINTNSETEIEINFMERYFKLNNYMRKPNKDIMDAILADFYSYYLEVNKPTGLTYYWCKLKSFFIKDKINNPTFVKNNQIVSDYNDIINNNKRFYTGNDLTNYSYVFNVSSEKFNNLSEDIKHLDKDKSFIKCVFDKNTQSIRESTNKEFAYSNIDVITISGLGEENNIIEIKIFNCKLTDSKEREKHITSLVNGAYFGENIKINNDTREFKITPIHTYLAKIKSKKQTKEYYDVLDDILGTPRKKQ